MLDTVAPLLTRVLCWQVLLPSFVVLYALLWVAQECGRRLSCPANAKLAPRLFSLPFIGYPMVIFTFPYHLDWFTPIHRKHSTFSYCAAGTEIISTTDPANLEHVLTQEKKYPKGEEFIENLHDLMGDSVFNTDGEHWRLQRKMSSKGFSREMMREHMMPVIVDQCALLMQRLRTVAVRGEVFDMQAVCQQFTLDVMCEILYGVRIGSMNGKNMPYSQAVDIAEDLSFKRFFLPDWKILRRFNIGRERKMKRAMQTINDFAYKIIYARTQNGKIDERRVFLDRVDMLTRFASEKDDNGVPVLSAQQLRDMVVGFMVAGRDTTSQLILWTLLCLHRNPDVLKRVQAEVDAAGDSINTFEGVMNGLPQLMAAVQETIRMYPPAPMNAKYATEDDILPDGTFVKKGTRIEYSPYIMARMERLWDEPLKFKPERFANGMPSPFKHVAFSAGPRACLGRSVAYMEGTCALAHILREFSFEVLTPEEKIRFTPTITAFIPGGLNMRMRERKPAASPAEGTEA